MIGGATDAVGEDLSGDDNDDFEGDDGGGVAWPYDAHTWPQTFGRPCFFFQHAVVQYRFKNGADPTLLLVSG